MHQQNVGKNYSIKIVNVLQMWLCSNILEQQQIKFFIHEETQSNLIQGMLDTVWLKTFLSSRWPSKNKD